ncbi:MAG TPA: protein kinase [Polyangiaceae bacterium]
MANAPSAPKLCTTCGARYPADALFCPADGTPLQHAATAQQAQRISDSSGGDRADPYVGRELAGHIEVRQLAGVGAMGRVYRAFQRGIDRDVAVKILHRELSANAQLVARFHREAKVASRLLHPNVVQVHLAGQLPDGALYIVMEYLDGLSLQSAFAAAGGAVPLQRALHIALQICDAVGEAHAQGIVHRDLKPENVMLVHRGEDPDFVKVLDFGIARLDWGEQSMATAAGLIFGTARYISPEGAQGEQVGPQGDVYSIATLVFQMLAGRTPFEGEQAVGLLVQQIHDAPPPLKSIPRSSYVPESISEVLMANLAKDKTKRAPDARALGRALLEAAKQAGLSPEDLVARSVLLGSRANALQLQSMQRTRQLQLEKSVDEMVAASGADRAAPSSSPEVPAPRVSGVTGVMAKPPQTATLGIAGAPSRAGGPAPTQKWIPPEALRAQMAGRAPMTPASPMTAPPGTGTLRESPSNVDITLDDASGQTPPPRQAAALPGVPAAPPSGPGRTHLSTPSPVAFARTDVRVEPSSPSSSEGYASRPEPTVLSEERSVPSVGPLPISRARRVAIGLLVFLLGIGIASAVAYRMRLLGSAATQGTLDEAVTRSEGALRLKHFDAPAGDNVRELTGDGLAKWPRDSRLLDVRARACDELVKEAVGRQLQGDVTGALAKARLANELDPADTTAQQLTNEYDAQLKGKSAASAVVVIPSLDAGRAAPSQRAPVTASGPFRTALDVAPAKPQVGQSVDLVVKVTTGGGAPKKPLEEPRFVVSGAAIGGRGNVQLPAFSDADGVFRASFTFLAPGKYAVTFLAKSDAVIIKAERAVVTREATAPANPNPGPAPANSAPGETPSAAPSASVKWM